MAIIGITLDRTNPEFTKQDFLIWMPQFRQYIMTDCGDKHFQKLVKLANDKIFESIYGADWEYAMSLCIAHYLTLIAQQMQAPSGDTLAEIAGGGTYKGILSSMTIGGFHKTYELSSTMVSTDDAKFWNQTSYGAALMALLETKSVPTIFVVTSNPVPGA